MTRVASVPGWSFFIDRGGTFTDCIGVDPDAANGHARVVKILSDDRAPLVGMRRLMGLADGAPIPPCELRLGTTLATNALLERRGARTLLVITRGFGDILEIGDQTRPDLFDLSITRPPPLVADVVETDARRAADGSVLAEVDTDAVRAGLAEALERGCESVAVVVVHDHRDGALESAIGELARAVGFRHVSLSHEVDPALGLLMRTRTTVVDAYLTPVLTDYVNLLRRELPGSRIRIMQSSGTLVDAANFRGRDAVLSGPAGGAVAVAEVARGLGLAKVIGFDMGGTSTDVCRWDGAIERRFESEIAGTSLRAPMVAIHTIAAGGGSICRLVHGRLTVGPDSAGAHPGPLCYGANDATQLTLTDVNLVLGRIDVASFPMALDVGRARAALEAMAHALGDRDALAVAEGFVAVAVANMAEAIRSITLQRGHDVRDYTLVAFGGAAGQHACRVADALGMRQVVIHPLAGVMSALGMGLAPLGWAGERDVGRPLIEDARLEPIWDALEAEGRVALARQGAGEVDVKRCADVRYRGSDFVILVESLTRETFEARHETELGYRRPGHALEVAAARVMLTSRVAGPAIVAHELTRGTVIVDPGWVEATHTSPMGPLTVLEAHGTPARAALSKARDPILLAVFHGLFQAIAEQMGRVLQRTAMSTNIRERLDFSCAIFDADGGLVANAPHIPVHLGAMGESVRAVMRAFPDMAPGDAFVTNDPQAGGSHLPDVTVVRPVHDDRGRVRFFTACRGHHADIGGTTPGSMPPMSRTLDEEGVVLPPLRLARGGTIAEDDLRARFVGATWPARNPDENIADLRAQLAAAHVGARLLLEACARHGDEVVAAYMAHIQEHAAEIVSAVLARVLPDGVREFRDALDDGTVVAVKVSRVAGRVVVDFRASSDEVDGNLNAPRAVTLAALLFVIRALVREPIPLNGGCLRDVDLLLREGSVLAPRPGRAVVAGNVETSQRVVDVLLGAFGVAAASQGTMNNLAFGDAGFGYYETLGGGAGAGRLNGVGWHGVSAVHTHMTNTRITDVEILESRFPVRVVRFTVRRGSGGAGTWRGGDGLVRELEALAPLRVTFITERRVLAPWGLAGGGPGVCGRNTVNGVDVGGRAMGDLRPGDRFMVATPGGGGFSG